jgi:hypothetical protein
VAEADLLELVVGEVVGLVMALGVPAEAVAAGLGELLTLAVRPILHGPAEIAASPFMRPGERQGIEVAVVEDRGFGERIEEAVEGEGGGGERGGVWGSFWRRRERGREKKRKKKKEIK